MAEIDGMPMIVHVWRRAIAAAVAPVLVATDAEPIAKAVEAVGGKAVLTKPNHPAGSDRIFRALQIIDFKCDYDIIISLQGDMLSFRPDLLGRLLGVLDEPAADIATLAAPIAMAAGLDPNVVTIVGSRHRPAGCAPSISAARQCPSGAAPSIITSASMLIGERRSKPACAFMRIDVGLVDDAGISVDAPDDLERARAILRQR